MVPTTHPGGTGVVENGTFPEINASMDSILGSLVWFCALSESCDSGWSWVSLLFGLSNNWFSSSWVCSVALTDAVDGAGANCSARALFSNRAIFS